MDTNILTSNGVDINKALELLGDMDMYNDTLKDFLEESRTRIPNIINYFNAGDMPNYAILVHAMKSDSKYLGFTDLAQKSYDHEMASKENRVDFVKANINDLLTEANRILVLVKQYLGVN